jgi:hypothetical protein
LTIKHSWHEFGREAEYVVALYLKCIGWKEVNLSPGSRGPADIIATCNAARWFIQVKASNGVPRLRGYEIKRLMDLANCANGVPVIATYQPFDKGFTTGNYSILFYLLDSWHQLDPVAALTNNKTLCTSNESH